MREDKLDTMVTVTKEWEILDYIVVVYSQHFDHTLVNLLQARSPECDQNIANKILTQVLSRSLYQLLNKASHLTAFCA